MSFFHSLLSSSRGGYSALTLSLYDTHAARVVADGGVIESEALTKAYIETLVDTYSLTSEAEFITKLPVTLNPSIFGYKVGTGSGITLGQAAEKLYSINEDADVVQATAASQPLLLKYNGLKYYYVSRIANNDARTTNSEITAYNTGTDTFRFTARIWMNEQTTTTYDYIGSIGAAGNFAIANKNASKVLRFRGSANALDSSSYTPSATNPHWVRYTISTTQVMYEWSADMVDTAAEVVNWTAIGTQSRPTMGTLSATIQIGLTAGTTANAKNVYYALFENVTAGTTCTFNPALYDRVNSEAGWIDADCTWGLTVSTGTTGMKSIMVDETVIVGDGVAYKLSNSDIVISQPYTAYASIRRLGTGVIYGLAASSQLSNDATNTTLNNGTALTIAHTDKIKQLITAVANGASSSLQVDNGTASEGNAGANNGTYLDVLANGAAYGNYVLTSLMISNGA